jgi:hypothetical protein
MATDRIGSWSRRHRSAAKWHYVDSTVAGDIITRCGRRMDPRSSDGVELEYSESAGGAATSGDRCTLCDGNLARNGT